MALWALPAWACGMSWRPIALMSIMPRQVIQDWPSSR